MDTVLPNGDRQKRAKFIFEAVTDRTKQLRHVETEDIKSWVGAR
jgi:hypothetical protein